MTMKKCTKCESSDNGFYASQGKERARCKVCHKEDIKSRRVYEPRKPKLSKLDMLRLQFNLYWESYNGND